MATILVVDDRETNRQLLRTLLGYQRHTVVEACDGEEGLQMAIQHRPDLIITDILMPHVDGFEFLRNLRRQPDLDRTPVIVYTATYVEQEALALAKGCGAFRVLLRPTDPEVLIKTVAEALESDVPTPLPVPDEAFAVEHRRILTDKLAQKLASLEEEVAHRKEGEARLAAALSAAGQRVLDWDIATNVMTVSGSDPEGVHVVEQSGPIEVFLDVVHREDIAILNDALERGKQSHAGFVVQYRRNGPGDEVRVMEAHGQYRFDEEGQPERLFGAILDVTDRVAEAKERKHLAAVVEHSSDLIASADLDGNVKFINLAGRRLLGIEDDEVVEGSSMYRDIDPIDVIALRDTSMPILLQTGDWAGEIQFVHRRTGERIPCDCACMAIRDSSGIVNQLSVIARDLRGRRETQRELNARLAQLMALRRIDIAISGAVDLQLTLQIVIVEMMGIESVLAAGVFIYVQELRYLDFAAGSGLTQDSHLLRLAEVAVAERRAVRDEFPGGGTLEAIPLLSKGVVRGVLAVVKRQTVGNDHSVLQFIEAISGQVAIAIDSALLFEDLQRSRNDLAIAYDETLEGWSRALDLRDKETEGHSRRVTELTLKIAREMRVPPESMQHIRRGALLHDIGKVGVPDAILLKPGPLNDDETAIMRKHAEYAVELLGPIAYLQPAMDIPFCHHEKWDGSGYPRGLRGVQIPLAARIFAIADVYDALSSDRPYRKAWSQERVMEYIRSESGTHFDPLVVTAFFRVLHG